MRTLVLGGIHSGKSAYAEELIAAAAGAESTRYLATAVTPATGDPEWTARIDRHRRRRPSTWTTVETGELAGALRFDSSTPSLVDDLGNWVSSYLDSVGGWDDPTVDLSSRTADLCASISGYTGDLVLVSPEVGLSLVAPTPSGRRFQQELGSLNAAVAAVCDRVVLVVAGRPMELIAESDALVTVTAAPAATPDVVPEPVDPPATGDVTLRDDPARPDETLYAADEFDVITSPSYLIVEQAQNRQRQLTKPPGSLGRLEEIANWVASCQGVCPPTPFHSPTVVVFAGDHGVADAGVSAYPPEVTAQMVTNIIAGGAAINVIADRAGVAVRVEDIAVDADTDPSVSRYKVRRGSRDLRTTDTLSAAEANAAVANGRAIADELVDSGVDLLVAGDLGIGNTTPAATLIGVLTDSEPVVVVGRGTGIDDDGWIRKTAAIRDGMRRGRAVSRSPMALLAAVAGADLAAIAGFLAQAAARRTPVILDGVVVTAAALVAEDLAPGAAQWWLAGHRSDEPAHSIALRQLDLEPVLEFSMRLGEGSGAVTAVPVVQVAVATLASMATFADAGVSDAAAVPV